MVNQALFWTSRGEFATLSTLVFQHRRMIRTSSELIPNRLEDREPPPLFYTKYQRSIAVAAQHKYYTCTFIKMCLCTVSASRTYCYIVKPVTKHDNTTIRKFGTGMRWENLYSNQIRFFYRFKKSPALNFLPQGRTFSIYYTVKQNVKLY